MANKTTKRDYFNKLLAIEEVANDIELVNFINHELELLDKKNRSKSGELTETQKENLKTMEEITIWLNGKKDTTIAEIRKQFGLSSQKVTPLMTKLVEEGKVTKVTDKRVSYYNLV